MSTRHRLARAVAAGAVVLAGVVLPTTANLSAASAAVTHQLFIFTGSAQTFTVPPGVTQVFVQAIGGSGGTGADSTGHPGGTGGAAAGVSAALPVTPGEKLDVYVGGAGSDGSNGSGTGGSSSGLFAFGSAVSGGGPGPGDGLSLGRGGGGGGATAILSAGTPVLVAGGGGGGGGSNTVASGGAGGAAGATAGDGATGDGPGGSTGGRGAGAPGLSGSKGQVAFDFNGAGGGGGQGWLFQGSFTTGGGSGGGAASSRGLTGGGGGGGAGASSVTSSATNVHITTAAQRGNGDVQFLWSAPATTTTLAPIGQVFPGGSSTYSATVSSAAGLTGDPLPSGTVTFFDGTHPLATQSLFIVGGKSVASYSTSSLTPGLHAISAVYNGDPLYDGSTSITWMQQVDAYPVITSAPTANGVVGVPFSFAVRTTGFPSTDVTSTGSLDGLILTPNHDGNTATLAGRPAAAGTFPITLTANNGLGTTAVQHFTLTVVLVPLSIGGGALPPAFLGQAYSATLTSAGGTPPVTWTVASGSLPSGLTLNRSTGAITGTPTTAGARTFTIKATDPGGRSATRTITLGVTGVVPSVYVANGGNDSVTSYPLGGGNVSPTTRLAGIGQGLNGPGGVVLNDAGRLYVADGGADAITGYDRGATTPTVTIAGAHTGLTGPAGITLDGAGRLYVADRPANTVTVYAPGASGDAAPVATLAGPDTGLSGPAAVAIDGTGRLWVANSGNNSLTAYAAGATGDAKPVATIAGSATGLNDPQGLAQDAAGNLLVANTFGESVTAYAPTASGNAFPIRTIAGSGTGLSFPTGIDVDTAGRIYVANQFDNDVTVYSASASGNAAPSATIAGSATGLAGPGALAVTPPLSVRTNALRAAAVGHRYTATLLAGQGTSPYRWAVAGGHLPPGLHLLADGTVTGTPTRTGLWTLTVRVTDAAHPATTATGRIAIPVTR